MAVERQIAFVDRSITDIETFLAGLRPEIEPIVLESSEAAASQIARSLRDHPGVAAIHIVAHGSPGAVAFGAGALSLDNLDAYADDLKAIGGALDEGGALFLWTCKSGEGERGAAFTEGLAKAAGADVTAATGLVGATAQGGCWALDTGPHAAAARPPLTAGGLAQYAGVMAFTPAPTTGDDVLDDDPFDDDAVDALAGADTIRVSGGNDTVDGSGGIDRLVVRYSGYAGPFTGGPPSGGLAAGHGGTYTDAGGHSVTFTGIEHFSIFTGAGDDSFTTGEGDDVLVPGQGQDEVHAGLGNDIFEWGFGDGDDILLDGGDGTDTLDIFGNLLANTIHVVTDGLGIVRLGEGLTDNITGIEIAHLDLDQGGSDTLSYAGTPVGVTVDLTPGALSATGFVSVAGNIDVVFGGSGNDTITGDDGFNSFAGLGGNDTLNGLGGDDFLQGWEGDDALNGGDGDDTFNYFFGDGNDTVDGGADDFFGDEQLVSGAFGAVAEWFNINPLTGTSQFGVNIAGSVQPATLLNSQLVITAVESLIILTGDGGDTVTIAGDFTDSGLLFVEVLGGVDDDTVDASGIIEGAGVPVDLYVRGFEGNDTLIGGPGLNVLDGGDGNDILTDASGSDIVDGGAGDDVFNHTTQFSDNLLVGGDDDDTLNLYGTAGDDLFLVYIEGGVLLATAASPFAGVTDIIDIENAHLFAAQGGHDELSYLDNLDAVSVDLTLHTATGFNSISAGIIDVSGGLNDDTLVGDGQANELFGDEGNDTISGGDNDDILVGWDGDDILSGDGGDDEIYGDFGNDIIDGGAGNDRIFGYEGDDDLDGGAGDDTFTYEVEFVDGADTVDGGEGDEVLGDRQIVLGTVGADTFFVNTLTDSPTRFGINVGGEMATLLNSEIVGRNVEHIEIRTGDGGDSVTVSGDLDDTGVSPTSVVVLGGSGDDTFIASGVIDSGGGTPVGVSFEGYAGSDTLTGGDGNDTLNGGDGDDALDGGGGQDSLIGGAGVDTMTGGQGNDVLNGGADDDSLTGEGGNDTLIGGAGADAMNGGPGNDHYYVDAAGDSITELPGPDGGIDTVVSALVTHTLGAHLENLVFSTALAHTGTGNELNNVITGNNLSDTLDGGLGDDRLKGGLGNDTLIGGEGNDTLIGGGGADSMAGGIGGDAYDVDETADSVTEQDGEGTDVVNSSAPTYTLSDYVENLVLTGTAMINGIGNGLANVMTGNGAGNVLSGMGGNDTLNGGAGMDTLNGDAGNDTLNGGDHDDTLNGGDNDDTLNGGNGADTLFGDAGSDVLNGNAGADAMSGGTGNDTYYVDNGADTITEGGDPGTDLVLSSAATYTLSANVENLTLTGGSAIDGTGNGQANVITGNGAHNVISGGGGNDTLNGAGGADTMIGGADNDIYYVDHAGDVVTEDVDAGVDTVYAIMPHTLAVNVENLILTSALAGMGTGNAGNNVITGNSLNDILNGLAGNDILKGGLGNDTLDGGADNDTLRAGGGNDILIYDSADMNVTGEADEDTLRILGSGTTLDLTLIPDSRIRDIEIIDLTGSGSNSVVLSLSDVLAISSSTDTLRIDGNGDDQLTADSGWTKDAANPPPMGGNDYYRYTNGATTLLVDIDIGSNLPV